MIGNFTNCKSCDEDAAAPVKSVAPQPSAMPEDNREEGSEVPQIKYYLGYLLGWLRSRASAVPLEPA